MPARYNAFVARSVFEVVHDHMTLRLLGDYDSDAEQNFAVECVLLAPQGEFAGIDGVKRWATDLQDECPGMRPRYKQGRLLDDGAYLEWTAQGDGFCILNGQDTVIVSAGRIQRMLTRYTIARRQIISSVDGPSRKTEVSSNSSG